jgi:hypothetical protein
VLPVPEVAPLPAEEVVAWVAVEVAAQSADLVPEFGRDGEFQKADAVPQYPDSCKK